MKRRHSSVGLLALIAVMCFNTTVNAAEIEKIEPEVVDETIDENVMEEVAENKEVDNSEDNDDLTQEEIVESDLNEIAANIPDEINTFADNNYKDLIDASIPYYSELTSNNVDAYELQDAYVVYDNDESNPEIYYYPVSLDDTIVMVLSVVNTSDGLTISGSEEMVDGLNRIDYESNSSNIVFYENGNTIEAENEDGKVMIAKLDDASGVEAEAENDFVSLDLEEKIDIVAESVESTGSLNINHIKQISEDNQIEEAYSPAFNTNTSTNKTCKLYNAQSQGSLPICWAASVATIVNYRKGTSATAKNVCDKMNTGYVGANIDTKKNALAKYGLSYTKRNSQLSYSSIKTNINNKYPIAASTFDNAGNGHAVTVYGWNMPKVTEYIVIWNSGTGSSQTMYYNPNGSTYTYNNKTWTWTKSLSYY